ncbi:MAG: PKD domain-containing protein [Ferruginibacter sp.]
MVIVYPSNIQFTNNSTGSPVGYLWDFGNGSKSNLANPIVTFTSPGAYTVRLITVYANNTAQKTRNIVIHPSISATFNSDVNYICRPGVVNFTASSSANLANYIWDFGDASPLVTGTSNNIAHTYTGFGEFTVTLKAISNSGCSISSTRSIKIIKPEISGSIISGLNGCVPVTTDFRTTVVIPPGSTVSNYLWQFGDASSLNNTSQNISHTYTQDGAYSPSVTVTTAEGCTNMFKFDSLFFGTPPTNHNAFPVDTVYCGSETPQFISHATNANRYDWDFTGGGNITSVTDTLVEHRYSNLGIKHITVTPVYNGCPGTPINFQVNIIGVIARFTYANTCEDRKTFLFDNTSQGNISTIHWSLGNQSYSQNMDTVSHTYPQSGVFGVKLLISDNITGCVDSFKTRIYTANPVLKNNDQSICINTDTHFSITNNYSNPNITYLWNLLGTEIGPTPDAAPIMHADSLGHFNSQAILDNGPQYCPDTIHLDHLITVRGPQLDFTMPESICLNVPLTVVNHSHAYQPGDTVNVWSWNFGGSTANINGFQPEPYTYSSSRIYPYRVKLTATDITGCTDSLVKKVFVRPMPFIWIIPKLDTLCEGQSTTLTGYTSDDILWTPGSSNFCATCDTTTMSPTLTTKYYATVTNSFSCVSVDSALVKVFNPFTTTPLTPNESFCGGRKIPLDVEPKNKVITWSPAASLSNANIYNPVASPQQSTVYTATLIDSAGCFSSETNIRFNVNPIPLIDAGADKVYPYNAGFRIEPAHSSNIASWLWMPGDSLDCNTCPVVSGIALHTKTYSVTVTSDSGCVAQDLVTIFVECKDANLLMPRAFTPNHDRRNDYYRPITRGISYIKRFAIFNREGECIYEARNYVPNKTNDGWDGMYKGKDQNGAAYMYFIEAVCDIGQTIFSKGSFILIR